MNTLNQWSSTFLTKLPPFTKCGSKSPSFLQFIEIQQYMQANRTLLPGVFLQDYKKLVAN